ncbi:MAG: protein kinase [Polyangiaceae bacterium]|nr:protein kinase [Polyangiaceae bacterium]
MRCGHCRHLNPPETERCSRCGAGLAEQVHVSPWVQPGLILGGRYLVRHSLGAGGVGAVFAGRDRALGRDVALKVLLPTLVADVRASSRVAAEARALAQVSHPNVVSIFDVLEHEGLLVLVLELVPGGTMADLIERGPTPIGKAVWLVTRILEGLQAIHEAGFVHRDVKPTNVLLTARGMPKLSDLGVVHDSLHTRFTATGAVLGTFGYMAPEQALGKTVTLRADIYTVGLCLFELVTGQPAFPGDEKVVAVAQRASRPFDFSRLPPGTPPTLAEVLRRALEPLADRRWPTAFDMARALDILTSQSSCPPASFDLLSSPSACPPGSFGGMASPSACPPGSFGGMASPSACPPGSFGEGVPPLAVWSASPPPVVVASPTTAPPALGTASDPSACPPRAPRPRRRVLRFAAFLILLLGGVALATVAVVGLSVLWVFKPPVRGFGSSKGPRPALSTPICAGGTTWNGSQCAP